MRAVVSYRRRPALEAAARVPPARLHRTGYRRHPPFGADAAPGADTAGLSRADATDPVRPIRPRIPAVFAKHLTARAGELTMLQEHR